MKSQFRLILSSKVLALTIGFHIFPVTQMALAQGVTPQRGNNCPSLEELDRSAFEISNGTQARIDLSNWIPQGQGVVESSSSAQTTDGSRISEVCIYPAYDRNQVGGCGLTRRQERLLGNGALSGDNPTLLCGREVRLGSDPKSRTVWIAASDLANDGFGSTAKRAAPLDSRDSVMNLGEKAVPIPFTKDLLGLENRPHCPVAYVLGRNSPLSPEQNPLLGWSLVTLNHYQGRYDPSFGHSGNRHQNSVVCTYAGSITEDACTRAGGRSARGPKSRSPEEPNSSLVSICTTSIPNSNQVILQVGMNGFDLSDEQRNKPEVTGTGDVTFIQSGASASLRGLGFSSAVAEVGRFNSGLPLDFLSENGVPNSSIRRSLCPPAPVYQSCRPPLEELPFGLQVFRSSNEASAHLVSTGDRCTWTRSSDGNSVQFARASQAGPSSAPVSVNVAMDLRVTFQLSSSLVGNGRSYLLSSSSQANACAAITKSKSISGGGREMLALNPSPSDGISASRQVASLNSIEVCTTGEYHRFKPDVLLACDSAGRCSATLDCRCSMHIRDGMSLPSPLVQRIIDQKAPWDNQIIGISEGSIAQGLRTVRPAYVRDGETLPSQCVRSSYVPEVIQQ